MEQDKISVIFFTFLIAGPLRRVSVTASKEANFGVHIIKRFRFMIWHPQGGKVDF
jgi:hypothetical protein